VPIEIALMVEGQDGLNWPRWAAIARAAEEGGFAGLYRSDHFVTHRGPRRDALETWASLTWLATHTRRIEFGSLVSPITLRNPVVLALTAAAVDDLSGGRLQLGLGTGWQEREHRMYGFELPPFGQRFDRFAEALAVITGLLRSPDPVTRRGATYRLDDAALTPRPARAAGPPIVIGGKGPRRTLPLIARYGDEWNSTGVNVAEFRELGEVLDDLLRAGGRDPRSVRRSLMTTVVWGANEADLARRLGNRDAREMYARNRFVGTTERIVDQLRPWDESGLDRVMLRWENFDDADGIRRMGEALNQALGR